MENFDIKESWLVKTSQSIDELNDKINEKDSKFFNLKRDIVIGVSCTIFGTFLGFTPIIYNYLLKA